MPTSWKTGVDRWRVIAIAAVLLGVVLIVVTYPRHSQTFDEAVHVVTGLEWLERGRYTIEPQHPPLTRIAVAIGPQATGVDLTEGVENLKPYMWEEGDKIFFRGPSYIRTLTLARLGTLPFYFLLAWAVWLWGNLLLGRPGAAVATGFVALAPPVLGHAGLATTDVGLTATLILAVYALIRWLDEPTIRRAALLGAAGALALTSKFSAIPYLGLCVLLFGAWRVWHARSGYGAAQNGPMTTRRDAAVGLVRQLLAASATCAFVIWAVYRFSIINLHGVPVPAGELLRGFKDAFGHSVGGHYSYLLGERSRSGWWYYFPVVIAVKTPLVLLALGAAGAGAMLKQWRIDWRIATPVLLVIAVLVTGVLTNINIGVRHILPLYAAWAVLAAAGTLSLCLPGRAATMRRALVTGALVWFTVDVVRETPHHLAYFNELSRSDPADLLVDSNLDWGQDMLRLSDELARRGISAVSVSLLSRPVFANLTSARVTYLAPGHQATGWIAASETCLRHVYPDTCGPLDWLNGRRPVARVGRSILLYHVPDSVRAVGPSAQIGP